MCRHGPKPFIIWLIGLPFSGKDMLASNLTLIENLNLIHISDKKLRLGVNQDLTNSPYDRIEGIRRTAEIAKLFYEEENNIIVTNITPLKRDRLLIKSLLDGYNLYLAYLKLDIRICINRIKNNSEINKDTLYPGIDLPFETPENVDIVINGENTLKEQIDEIINFIEYKTKPIITREEINHLIKAV